MGIDKSYTKVYRYFYKLFYCILQALNKHIAPLNLQLRRNLIAKRCPRCGTLIDHVRSPCILGPLLPFLSILYLVRATTAINYTVLHFSLTHPLFLLPDNYLTVKQY